MYTALEVADIFDNHIDDLRNAWLNALNACKNDDAKSVMCFIYERGIRHMRLIIDSEMSHKDKLSLMQGCVDFHKNLFAKNVEKYTQRKTVRGFLSSLVDLIRGRYNQPVAGLTLS